MIYQFTSIKDSHRLPLMSYRVASVLWSCLTEEMGNFFHTDIMILPYNIFILINGKL